MERAKNSVVGSNDEWRQSVGQTWTENKTDTGRRRRQSGSVTDKLASAKIDTKHLSEM